MYNERTVNLTLNCEQKCHIELALHERIRYLEKCQERCLELEIASHNPLYKQEYKKMGETYQQWIEDVTAVLEHIECETREIKP